jgi:hypothetical protein
MKGFKIVIAIVAVVVVLVVVGMFFLFSKLDSLLVKAIEEAGSHVTGTEVTVDDVDIGIREGRASVTGLKVSNPDGFSDRDAFQLGEITFAIDLQSAQSQDPIVIELISVASPSVLFELDESGKSNVDVVRNHAEEVMGGSSSGHGSPEGTDVPLVVISSIEFEAGRIQGDASAVGVDPFEVDLPSFTLTDVGAPGGIQADQIGKTIILALTRKAAEAVARDKAGDVLQKQLKDALGDKSKGLLESVK